jgi:hypothetical protein
VLIVHRAKMIQNQAQTVFDEHHIHEYPDPVMNSTLLNHEPALGATSCSASVVNLTTLP